MKNILTILFLVATLFSFSQKRVTVSDKKIDVVDWIKMLSESESKSMKFVDCEIYFDQDPIRWNELPWITSDTINDKITTIKTSVYIENSSFLNNGAYAAFSNLKFDGGFYISDSEIGVLFFNNCSTNDFVISGSKITAGGDFRGCKLSSFGLNGCELGDDFKFNNCELEGNDGTYNHYMELKNNENISLKYTECSFGKTKEIILLDYSNNSFEDIEFIGCEFYCDVSFNSVIIENTFKVRDSKFYKNISFNGFQSPTSSTDINWVVLANKLFNVDGVVDNITWKDGYVVAFTYELVNPYYVEFADTSIDKYSFLDLINSFNMFYHIYKERGDIESANACYVELKTLETRRLKYLYNTQGGTKNFLNYYLNKFLKFFAEYGTSPVRSIQISGWVVLIFAFFYFFFYSDWDKINRKYLMERGDKLISYFRSEQKLEMLYSEKHKDDLSTFTQFKKNLQDSKAQVPFFFMLFLKPLYWVAVIKHKGNKSLYKRIEFLQGKWVDLTVGKKILLGSLTFFTIIIYVMYLITIRSLNSLILSINTFTTLGFGDIPVVGISRYVAVLEGFLGWFLLSIFSVALISQILQN